MGQSVISRTARMEREDMGRKILIITILCVPIVVCSAEGKIEVGPRAMAPKTYGGAVVEKVIGVDEGFGFRCDVKGWPAVIGKDIAVKIDGIEPPLVVARGEMPNKFFELQAIKFLERTFAKAQSVKLRNIKRGRTFSIVADVIVDSNNVADLLITEGLAGRYVGAQEARISVGQRRGTRYDEDISVGRYVGPAGEKAQAGSPSEAEYVASKNSKVFHRAGCRYAKIVSASNLVRFDSKGEAQQTGRRACKTCNP
jgi:endonuclease YncB( thermonuclease family)